MIYKRFGRVSFYLGKGRFWLRVRTREMLPHGFFLEIGREGVRSHEDVKARVFEWLATQDAKKAKAYRQQIIREGHGGIL